MITRSLGILIGLLMVLGEAPAWSQFPQDAPRIAFIGLHGGVFETLESFAKGLNLRVEYISDDQIAQKASDLSVYRLVFIQHTREEDQDAYRDQFLAAKRANPATRIFAVGREGSAAVAFLKDRGDANPVETDPEVSKYFPRSRENLRRFLIYVSIKYLGQAGEILPPAESDETATGPYHPDHDGRFESVPAFLAWSSTKGREPGRLPRAAIMVHTAHLDYQQPRVVDALIRSLEAKGVLAAGFTDGGPQAADTKPVDTFKPDVIIHTCHSGETVEERTRLDAPHMHSLFFRRNSIDFWQHNLGGFTQGDAAFQVIGQEHLGAIEPLIGAGTVHGGGSAESFTPIPERIEHIVKRALSWIALRKTPHAEKRIAFVYYDREAGQNELMRGSATGMHLHAPKSMVKVLKSLKADGYSLNAVPNHENELIDWLKERGRQYGMWNQNDLNRLATSGQAVLLPVATYLEWLNTRVPEAVRGEVAKHWGPAPGNAMVWKNDQGQSFIVIPRIDLGNIILLPQPLRGEGQDPSLLHQGLTPPPHNYIATYFWLQESFKAHVLVHFGTHGSEFFLPANPVGLSDRDWPDILMGSTPNINPWIIDNVGEVAPVKRRAYAVTLGHLTPPIVTAGLSDDLLNLHSLIDKWDSLEAGALREGFRRQITSDVVRLHLAKEAGLAEEPRSPLTPEQIHQVVEYLHDIEGETTPISLHVLGEPPRDDLMVPFLTTILKRKFLEALGQVVPVPPEETRLPGDRVLYLRHKAEEAVELVVRRDLSPMDAVTAIGGKSGANLPPEVQKGLVLAIDLNRRFAKTTDEIDNLLAAFDGRFIPPGPVNSPIRNPGAVPTGRNLYMLNPEEIPTRPSWELAKKLVDQLLERSLKEKGHCPAKIAFDLRPHATFRDYGVMEAQILYCLGVEPVWDERDLVNDVRVIPSEILKRPRVDVFIAPGGLYALNLPGRLELIDKAIRLVAELAENDNVVRINSERVREELTAKGLEAGRALALSRARIFGVAPGEYGSPGNFAYIQQSGSWTTRDEVIAHYLSQAKNVYTKGHWGEPAPEAYDRQIQGTDTVLRSWSDHMTGPLANKYMWLHGGQLAMAVEHLTGKAPEFLLSDVRDFDRAGVIRAEDALAREFRVRLFNRKWIEGMMKEGYAGADQVADMVSNSMGWEVVREGSIPRQTWEEIDAIFMKDKLGLSIGQWFESENPFAFQELSATMLESIRKGYWKADAATTRRLVEAYARSVVRHGDNGGFRSGGNGPLRQYVERTLTNTGVAELAGLGNQYHARFDGSAPPLRPSPAWFRPPVPVPAPRPSLPRPWDPLRRRSRPPARAKRTVRR
ncbi:cobaltochelatase CobN subunit [Singulisphaera sp. GP187]|uniref:cobaltochelatase subunit CobN n=1 Tax=Singulisphaera sp. GP187 TaxID=1882752 RepID=UPI00092951B2|nr:cobaltochelatase subunit CobN [Singulisphaera sp. GP187]SIO59444.1 cobaltochelatase CobN subunit [Singulisphaera sp. GP187]